MPENVGSFNVLLRNRIACCGKVKQMVAAMGCPLLWTVWLDTDAQLEAEPQIRKLEEQLRLERGIWLFTTLLASGTADKMGKQDNKLESLASHFAKLGRAQLLWIKIQVLVTA